jgi:hypothetical protein
MYDTGIMLTVVKDNKNNKLSRKYNELDTNVLYELPIFAKSSKVYFRDNCGHSECYAFSRKKAFSFSTQRNQIVYSGQCEGRAQRNE